MYRSIVQSCDTYYYMLANDMGVDLIHDQLSHFGFGEITGIDIQGEVARPAAVHRVEAQGLQAARAAEVVRRRDHLAGHRPGLQQLHHAAAGHGHRHRRQPQGARMKPHLVKEVVDVTSKERSAGAPEQVGQLTAKPENLAIIRKALVGVNIEGTSAAAFKGAATSGGKTGTAQV
jgi:penicillin-binding protein 2